MAPTRSPFRGVLAQGKAVHDRGRVRKGSRGTADGSQHRMEGPERSSDTEALTQMRRSSVARPSALVSESRPLVGAPLLDKRTALGKRATHPTSPR